MALLLAAKAHSDRREYAAKHELMRRLLAASPQDFAVDSRLGRFAGLTHNKTQFKIHLPAAMIPAAVPRRG